MNEPARRIARFLVVGGVGFVVDAGILAAGISLLSLGPRVSRVMSFLAAMLVTWLLNRSFTFADRASEGRAGEFLRYGIASGVSACLNLGVYLLALSAWPSTPLAPYVALVLGVAAGLVSNFTLYRWIVFR